MLDINPLPASLKIELEERGRTFSRAKEIANSIAGFSGVADVEYGQRWLSKLDRLLSAVGAATLILGIILAISSVLVVATAIKLAFQVRREAVEIMRLVGATPSFVARPFLVEGAIYGLLGTLFGLVLLGLLYSILSRRLAGLLFLSPGLLGALLACGALLGVLGSGISLRKTRR